MFTAYSAFFTASWESTPAPLLIVRGMAPGLKNNHSEDYNGLFSLAVMAPARYAPSRSAAGGIRLFPAGCATAWPRRACWQVGEAADTSGRVYD